MRLILLFILSLIFQSCGCNSEGNRGAMRIGIDPYWYPINFGAQESYVNGFTEDLLLEIARDSGIHFERIAANWDNLLDGLREEKYDAVLTSLPPYEFHTAKFDFSPSILDLGPVLIVPVNASKTELSKMGGELVGVVTGDPAILQIQKYPDVVTRNYNSIPELLNALVAGEIEGALLNRVPAMSYVSDLYGGKLKIASAPLTDSGLRLVTPKGKQTYQLALFNKSLSSLKKKKKLQALLKKWEL